MVQLTRPDGHPVQIAGSRVIRVRAAYPEESTEAASRTRIDWDGVQFVAQEAHAVALMVARENAHLAALTLPDGDPVWIDATRADGPLPVTTQEQKSGLNSLVMLGGKRQFFANFPDEVRAALSAAGGRPRPVNGEVAVADW